MESMKNNNNREVFGTAITGTAILQGVLMKINVEVFVLVEANKRFNNKINKILIR